VTDHVVDVSVTAWLGKRGDKKCSGNKVALRRGGENISATSHLGLKVAEDFYLFLFLFFLSFFKDYLHLTSKLTTDPPSSNNH
jgi:hypothetical protein